MTDFASHFETKPRPAFSVQAGEPFVTLRDDAPEWLKEAVREAHQGDLPLDWIYAECQAAAQAIDAGDIDLVGEDDMDALHEHADGRVDIYTKELYQWAADFCLTDTWAAAEEAAREMGLPEETEKRLACVQYAAIHFVAETMRDACAKVAAAEPQAAQGAP